MKDNQIPVLLCGDMNSPPPSQVFAFMRGEKIVPYKAVAEENVHFYDKVTEEANKVPLALVGKFMSSYCLYPNVRKDGSVHRGFPPFTVYSIVQKVIDHIFFTKKHFEVVSLLEMPKQEDVADMLPNKLFPSDHLRIEAVLRFK